VLVKRPAASSSSIRRSRSRTARDRHQEGQDQPTGGPEGGRQAEKATFYDGIFKLKLGKDHDLTPQRDALRLRRARPHAAAAKKPKTRKLWATGPAPSAPAARYSAATVRGTTWLVQDSCAGTLTRVTKGVVSVFDNVKHKTILLKAGKQYLARARR
jgi:hypothetical protein